MTVYVIGEEGTDNVKIGFTNGEPNKRAAQLQVVNPRKMWVIYQDQDATEKEYHTAFVEKRVRGEWFNIPFEELLGYIRKRKYGIDGRSPFV